MIRRNQHSFGHKGLQGIRIVDYFHGPAAQHVRRTDQHRIADPFGSDQRIFYGSRGVIVRLLEIPQSIDIIEQCLAAMPEGPIIWEPKLAKLLLTLKKAKGEAVGRHEAPRGEVLHYVRMDAQEAPTTWKVKASSYSNLQSWIPMLRGEQIADIPIIVASIDPCLSCTDRVAIVRGTNRSIMTKEDLHRLSVEKTRRLQR